MRNKSYVNLGGIAMGIAGSYCNAEMFQNISEFAQNGLICLKLSAA